MFLGLISRALCPPLKVKTEMPLLPLLLLLYSYSIHPKRKSCVLKTERKKRKGRKLLTVMSKWSKHLYLLQSPARHTSTCLPENLSTWSDLLVHQQNDLSPASTILNPGELQGQMHFQGLKRWSLNENVSLSKGGLEKVRSLFVC